MFFRLSAEHETRQVEALPRAARGKTHEGVSLPHLAYSERSGSGARRVGSMVVRGRIDAGAWSNGSGRMVERVGPHGWKDRDVKREGGCAAHSRVVREAWEDVEREMAHT